MTPLVHFVCCGNTYYPFSFGHVFVEIDLGTWTWKIVIRWLLLIAYCYYKHLTFVIPSHGLRTPNEAFFHQNPKLLGLGRQFGQINFGAFGVFSTDLSAPILVLWVHCPCFPLINLYLIYTKKTKPLYPNPQYLFGIGIWIWIWATKN